tara:strand:- start:1117 stop:1329 length:213 start_codon:yes stop_codon:yes gene_type:complete
MNQPDLKTILESMDIPASRLDITPVNVSWLLRNLQVRNGLHPDCALAMHHLRNIRRVAAGLNPKPFKTQD